MFILVLGALSAQVPNPGQTGALTPAETGQPVPIFRVTVVSRTTKAINYRHRTGSTYIDFRGTQLMPGAIGEARVESQMGSDKVETTLRHMTGASQFGPEYMTYVLWGITSEGRAVNLGEVVLQGDHAKLLSTTDLQTFGLIVTAEPYFAVTQPSDVVVAENFVREDTRGTIEQVDANYHLVRRGQYVFDRTEYVPVKINPKGPLQLAEAENAVEIARLAGSQKYASDTFQKAVVDLRNAEDLLKRSHNRKDSETDAREATQMAEDARIITFRKMEEEEQARERAAAQQAATQAQQATAQAQQAAALAQEQAARAAAQQADQQRTQAEADKTQLRERLRQQFNLILETRETARGLIMNMSDVLFDTGKYSLKPGAREKLAKVSGILLAYPGLKIQVEGHTDDVGGDAYNQRLSEQRADAVCGYLTAQGVPSESVTAVGLGKADPVASNDTAAGRQQNRRVELVVSGEPIGVESGAMGRPR